MSLICVRPREVVTHGSREVLLRQSPEAKCIMAIGTGKNVHQENLYIVKCNRTPHRGYNKHASATVFLTQITKECLVSKKRR
jgi:hypothetical protein